MGKGVAAATNQTWVVLPTNCVAAFLQYFCDVSSSVRDVLSIFLHVCCKFLWSIVLGQAIA